MLRHTGDRRSFKHNLRLAVLLCLNAGFINAAGFLAFQVLTTNVTGHAALLAVYSSSGNLRPARMVALWLLLFLAGAFTSSLYILLAGRNKPMAYTAPILFIIIVLLFVATFRQGYAGTLEQTEYFAGSLLFAMGIQNAMVSVISGSVVRTTHLTGVFTDLGIDLSNALLSRHNISQQLKRKLLLRISIITCFLLGGLLGGICFLHYHFAAFYLPIFILILAVFYDYLRLKTRRLVQRRPFKGE